MKFLIMNGPNLNLLGLREPEIYGKQDFSALLDFCRSVCEANGIEMESYQSNHEGDLVDKIQDAYGKIDGIVINPAAYTHTSVAIPDALKAVGIPCAEVHLSDITAREDFRKHSFVSPVAVKTVYGKGFAGYEEAILFLKEYVNRLRTEPQGK